MATTPTDRLPGKIKVLYETTGNTGGWARAVLHGKRLAIKRQTDTFVDFRPSTGQWVAWSWAHHASPHVIDLSQVTDAHGRYGTTYAGPRAAAPQARAPRSGNVRRAKVVDEWSELNDSQRAADARRMRAQLGEMRAAAAEAKSAATQAIRLLKPNWTRAAKDRMIEALTRIKLAYESARLTGAANHLRDLPSNYGPTSIFSRAHELLRTHEGALRALKELQSLVRRATAGEPEQVRKALDDVIAWRG
jgi:hypothetical protein